MSFLGLSIAGSALDAYQEAANTTSNNISNVNTPGASRQIVNLTEAPPIVGSPGYATWTGPGTQGDGVLVESITRVHQDSYDALFRGASSSQYYYTVQSQQLTSLQSAFGEPNSGINTALANLQTAFSQLAANPASGQQGVMTAAQTFVATLNAAGTAVQNAKTTAISQADSVVTQVNDLVDRIAALNGQIRASAAVGDNPNTYKDQRDQDIDKLSQLVAVQTSVLPNGSTLVTIGGRALVNDTQAYHLAQPVVATNASGSPQLVVGFVGDPNPSNPQPVVLASGELAGYVDLYNNNLTQYGQQLDAFANATANAVNHVSESAYDANGNAGIALFAPVVSSQAITATNIQLGITSASQVSSALASTAAGSLTTSINSANNTVDTAAQIVGNTTLAHPGAAIGGSTTGTLTVTVDGVAQSFKYDIASGGNADSVGDFITSFNAAQLGVTASYDTVAQKIVFARDPNNESASLQARSAGNASPTFSITDSNAIQGGSQGTPSNSILEILGAAKLENAGPPVTAVVQNATNAFGGADNSAANAMLKVFSSAQPIPGTIVSASNVGPLGPGTVTLTPPAGNLGAFAQFAVGQQVTVDAAYGTAETVTISAVDRTTGTITVTLANAHNPSGATPLSVTATPSQTLGGYYGSLVTQMGYDAQSTTTATTTQTSLASNIDQTRQSIDGINLDEETQHLIQYQNAYTAAAKTVSVVAQLLQTAVGLIP